MVVRDYDYTVYEQTWMGNYENVLWVSKTVAHEIGHLYGVEDHYGVVYGDDRDNCIWGKNKEDESVCESFSMCETCYNTIKNNNGLFNHS